jgi:hypothetical protein
MSAAVRPIQLPGAAAVKELQERTGAALIAWGRQWLGNAEGEECPMLQTLRIRAVAPSSNQNADRYELVQAACGSIWFRCNDDDLARFAMEVVGEEPLADATRADDWVAIVAERAREARNRALHSALLGATVSEQTSQPIGALPADLFAFGSGAVEIVCDRIGLYAIADSGVWRCVPPTSRIGAHRPANVTPLDRATRTAHAQVEVILGSVELELPKLMDLRRGDVLRLPQRLDQSIAVRIEGKPLLRAELGEARGRKAVRIGADQTIRTRSE